MSQPSLLAFSLRYAGHSPEHWYISNVPLQRHRPAMFCDEDASQLDYGCSPPLISLPITADNDSFPGLEPRVQLSGRGISWWLGIIRGGCGRHGEV